MAAIIRLDQTPKWVKRRNLPPVRQRNQASRSREHLTPDEVERMILAARQAGGRMAYRDALLITMAYRHGLRASELVALRWDQINLKAGACTSLDSSRVHLPPIRCAAPSCAHCARGGASKATPCLISSPRCVAPR